MGAAAHCYSAGIRELGSQLTHAAVGLPSPGGIGCLVTDGLCSLEDLRCHRLDQTRSDVHAPRDPSGSALVFDGIPAELFGFAAFVSACVRKSVAQSQPGIFSRSVTLRHVRPDAHLFGLTLRPLPVLSLILDP